MISIASGFQYSVNIAYDLNNDEKIRNFIPTSSSLSLLESILQSTLSISTERSRILIGPYGKGKSHIMLMILSLLMKKDRSLFENMLKQIEGTSVRKSIDNYYSSNNKILPIVISGSNTSLTQAFLLALQRTLATNDYLDIMPETNYKAAIQTIEKWEKEFPQTYEEFEKEASVPPAVFIDRLNDYDIEIYKEFENIYPNLTAGSIFNPFLGFDVVDLYESVAKGLKTKGYTGIYVVYDEFSKYLEANIAAASISDTKMLQDFAEKCNRSGSLQMHIMLISHKEIANYIDVLPKQKIDGWRGVSERFLHVHLSNNFTQTYEIIESVIQKNPSLWKSYVARYSNEFSAIKERYITHPIFSNMEEDSVNIIYGCYPLHPVSTFILPRLSERVAQNERTLFTFLSANSASTLPAFLEKESEESFELITPDYIYDYFEPLFRKEIYSGTLHANYVLTETILEQLRPNSLESKIVKTLSLIYSLEQFETIKPTKEELFGIFSMKYNHQEIEGAIEFLIEGKYVVYLKRSNNYLQLKQSSGVDVRQKINDLIEAQRGIVSVEDALNEACVENYLFPSRYNDEHEMVRFFSFYFVDSNVVNNTQIIDNIISKAASDGFIFGVIPHDQDSISEVRNNLIKISKSYNRCVFVLPTKYENIEEPLREYRASMQLRDEAEDDRVLFDEYEVIYEDLNEVIMTYISSFTHPERMHSKYIYWGQEHRITRKSALTGLLSDICDTLYSKTPIINNEALNRNEATSIARTSRNKVVAGLLRSELEPNLGLSGASQDVSIMRSTLVKTGLLRDVNDNISIDLHPSNNKLISEMMAVIEAFIIQARDNGPQCFDILYENLCSPSCGIALRRELVPIFLAAVLHEYKKDVAISDRFGQVLISVDSLLQINAAPKNYKIEYLDWDEDKTSFINSLEAIFHDEVRDSEKDSASYEYINSALNRWYISLPKYTKDLRIQPDGNPVKRDYLVFLKLLRQNPSGYDFLFSQLPKNLGFSSISPELVNIIKNAKDFYDNAILNLHHAIEDKLKSILSDVREEETLNRMSVVSVIRDWCETLNPTVFEQVFADGTDKCLALFKSVSNGDEVFIENFAKSITDLRLEDWNDQTLERCFSEFLRFKETAESFQNEFDQLSLFQNESGDNNYQVVFVEENGMSKTKRFEKVEVSNRAKLLLNKVVADLDSFGNAVTEAEKRQILMDVLNKLC